MTIVEQIAEYLEDQGIGAVGTSIFWSYLPDPDSGDFNIAVMDTGGPEPDKYLPTKEPDFQVFVRAKDYATGKAKVDAIRTALHQKKGLELITDEDYFYFILLRGEGGHLGRNDAGRDEFSMNFRSRIR